MFIGREQGSQLKQKNNTARSGARKIARLAQVKANRIKVSRKLLGLEHKKQVLELFSSYDADLEWS